jgi:response regulator NasT
MSVVRPGPLVLLVDDDSDFREAVREMLHDRGFASVVEAADGRQAVVLAERLGPDVVLMDVKMPVLGGIEAARAMRRLRPELPIIMLTAYDDNGIRNEALAAGVDTYLLKGCSPSSIIDELLKAGGTGDGHPRP